METARVSGFEHLCAPREGSRARAMQLPAWVERGPVRSALQPGGVLQPGDIVVTGAASRVMDSTGLPSHSVTFSGKVPARPRTRAAGCTNAPSWTWTPRR